MPQHVIVTPSAARLTGSLRDIGYDFPSALADIVDNSIAAKAHDINIEIKFDGASTYVTLADDGSGMSVGCLTEALRFGSNTSYSSGSLGRYGLGLKTASLSQCRTLTVACKRPSGERVFVRQLDLDRIAEWNDWIVVDPGRTPTTQRARRLLSEGYNTVVSWDNLDRVLPHDKPEGGWARRRIEALTRKAVMHLSMVFHRFLERDVQANRVNIVVNGRKVEPWNPFANQEPQTEALPDLSFEVPNRGKTGEVRLKRFILPPKNLFSSADEWERLSGPLKWNRQQGLYIYRADRLVQWGGWAGLRAVDEHTKLARISLDFSTDLDELFNINVAKMRVTLPTEVKHLLGQPVNEACAIAGAAYRRASSTRGNLATHSEPSRPQQDLDAAGLALRTAALGCGEYEALKRIISRLADEVPEYVDALGLRSL